jgi:hypothetical protein
MNSTAFQRRPAQAAANPDPANLSRPETPVNKNPVISNFKPISKPGSSAKGVFDLEIGAFRFIGCMLLESNGKRWWNPPGQKQFDREGKPILDEKGKQKYIRVIEFSSKSANERLQTVVLDAIDKMQGGDL